MSKEGIEDEEGKERFNDAREGTIWELNADKQQRL